MAVIGKIRSYSGLLIIVIGIALAAFILGDLMGHGPMGRQEMIVGVVDRHKITYPEFESRVSHQTEVWKQQTGAQTIEPHEAFHLRQQVWSQYLREILLRAELESLGIGVSTDELTDLIIGKEPHPVIVQNFTNPADGSFDAANVINFIQNLNNIDPMIRNQWFQIEDFIKQQRLETKYYNLILKGIYQPDKLAITEYRERGTIANIRLITKRFTDFLDSIPPISKRTLRKVYNQHRYRFEQAKARDLEYVIFPIFPSDQDRQAVFLTVEGFKQELLNAENIEAYVNSVSDTRFDPSFVSPGQLPLAIDSIMFNSPVGTVYGPFLDQNSYVVAKLTEISYRPDSMKASHILITHQGAQGQQSSLTLDQAREKADSIYNLVRLNPARFGEIASGLSDDPSAINNQGDLGWFSEQEMVPQFSDAVLNTDVNRHVVAQSDFGFHVIHVTGKSIPTKKVQVALVAREIEYSTATYQQVFGQANQFAALLREGIDFDAAIDSLNLSKRVIDKVQSMDINIPGVENPRSIVQWAFADRTEAGSVSQIFDLDDQFVVARITRVHKEGIPPLDHVESQIMEIALTEEKARIIANRFLAAGSTLDEIGSSLGLEVSEITDIRFMQNSLPGFGLEPHVIGTIFATGTGNTSKPIKGNSGVFMIEVTGKTLPNEPESLSDFKTQLHSAIRHRIEPEVFRAIQESAGIKDFRHRFF